MKEELKNQGFEEDRLKIKYTATRVAYGNPIFLTANYEYEIKFPFLESQSFPMEITRNSVSKR